MNTISTRITSLIAAIFILISSNVWALSNELNLKIKATQNTFHDESLVYFDEYATENYDGNYDAFKLFGFNSTAPSIYSKIADGSKLAVNAYPNLTTTREVPIYIKIGQAGNYNISIRAKGYSNTDIKIAIKDLVTNISYDIKDSIDFTIYSGIVTSTANTPRFKVTFCYIFSFQVKNILCPGGNDGAISLYFDNGNSPYTYSWSNGQTTSSISDLTAGTYYCEVIDGNGVSTHLSQVLAEPEGLQPAFTISNTLCNAATGTAIVSFPSSGGGASTTSVEWSTNPAQFGDSAVNLSSGSYTCTISDTNNCVYISNILVGDDSCDHITSISQASCGDTVTLNDAIFCMPVSGRPAYEFSFTETQYGYTYSKKSKSYGLKLSGIKGGMLPGVYEVRVRIIKNTTIGSWSASCLITLLESETEQKTSPLNEKAILNNMNEITLVKHDLSLSPNPANINQDINIQMANENLQANTIIRIYNSVGQLILERQQKEGETKLVPDRRLSQGLYYVSAYTNKTLHTTTFVIKD